MSKNILALRKVVKEFRKGNKPVNGKYTINDKEYAVRDEDANIANLVLEAEKFVSDYIKENGTTSFLSERLRNGFIGEEVHTDNGTTYIQLTRGKPYGTVASIAIGDNIYYGTSYIAEEDKNCAFPVIGQYLALKKAIACSKADSEFPKIKSKTRKQFDHFVLRSKAFFFPDKYSYSRGSDPVDYPNYDEIKARRDKILGN